MKKKEEIPDYLQAIYDFVNPDFIEKNEIFAEYDQLGKNDPPPEELMAKHQNILNSPDRLW